MCDVVALNLLESKRSEEILTRENNAFLQD